MTNDGACFIHEWYITMLWPLSWEDDNWRCMNHTLGIYYHALIVVTGRWQLVEHVSDLRNTFPCSDRWHETVQLTEHVSYMNDILLVVVSWQRSEHGYISLRYETCSVSCHRLMPMDRAWLSIPQVWNMLRQLLSSLDNRRSMVIHTLGMKHAPSLVIVPWQQSEHGDTPHVWNTLCQLPSLHDNGQRMVMYSSGKKHAPSVVNVPRQRSEHGYISLRSETCSVSCHRLETADRAWLLIPKVSKMLRLLSSSHDKCQSILIPP